jgi:hypothetical protein
VAHRGRNISVVPFTQRGLWRGYAVRDGNPITGQQQFFGGDVGKLVVKAIGE